MNLILKSIENVVSDENNKNILYLVLLLLFGYTCSKINYPMNLNQSYSKKAVLVHGGGWKKLQSNNISKDQFKTKVEEYLGIKRLLIIMG